LDYFVGGTKGNALEQRVKQAGFGGVSEALIRLLMVADI
jgi:hypothetical protein